MSKLVFKIERLNSTTLKRGFKIKKRNSSARISSSLMVFTELPKSFFNENSMIRKHPKPDRNLQNQNARAMRQAFIF